jgi:hypothetical protein
MMQQWYGRLMYDKDGSIYKRIERVEKESRITE